MTHSPKQKLYCFVDETGQDAGSAFFIVAVVVVWGGDIEQLRARLIALERVQKIGSKKWHKLRQTSRLTFMQSIINDEQYACSVYFNRVKKPIPFYFPTLEVIQGALAQYPNEAELIVSIDGFDAISAKKMTNALRTKYRHVKLVKGPKDESEVLIRLADRWAGCLRLALLEANPECKAVLARAYKKGLLTEVK